MGKSVMRNVVADTNPNEVTLSDHAKDVMAWEKRRTTAENGVISINRQLGAGISKVEVYDFDLKRAILVTPAEAQTYLDETAEFLQTCDRKLEVLNKLDESVQRMSKQEELEFYLNKMNF